MNTRNNPHADGDLNDTAPSPEAAPTMLVSAAPSEQPGDRIGRYKLLQLIGEGGCGAVYMAEQQEPVRRRVASLTLAALSKRRRADARFLSGHIQRVSFLAVLLVALTACSPKNEPVSIDKSQIDLTSLMVQDLDSASNEEKYYNLLYPGDSPRHPGTVVLFRLLSAAQPGSLGANDLFRLADPLQTNREKLVALSGRNVQITDGRTLLATGRISGWVGGPGDWHVKVRLESPGMAKALGRAWNRFIPGAGEPPQNLSIEKPIPKPPHEH